MLRILFHLQVAALSGDARRALDICRRATDLAESDGEVVKMKHVNDAIQEMYQAPKIVAMRLEKYMSFVMFRYVAVQCSNIFLVLLQDIVLIHINILIHISLFL